MDFSTALGIKYRVIKEVTHDGEPVRLVSGSAIYDTVPDDLWDALTNPERIPRWFSPVSGELQTGGRYQIEGNAGGEITRCDPPEAFDITWECGGSKTWVRVRLDSEGDGTRLTLEHLIPKDEASEEHWRKYGPGATGVGWDLSFMGLSLHLQTGETVPQDDANAWFGTDEGKVFLRQCAAAWGDAHIEAGEEDAVAKGMAENTGKFYCGEQ
ncbi:MAG: SRPBCC family protein [Planctomycetota bacterium]